MPTKTIDGDLCFGVICKTQQERLDCLSKYPNYKTRSEIDDIVIMRFIG